MAKISINDRSAKLKLGLDKHELNDDRERKDANIYACIIFAVKGRYFYVAPTNLKLYLSFPDACNRLVLLIRPKVAAFFLGSGLF